ncbi:hypothetical protein MLD38_026701 [Melastoma candidum]|uniref:Uncharacterized protein n=1 Tax=Melastoma candidum TaxID=119954 RepID=A0ACB9P2X3_9MYRT|nr:hypothetical protein MLD38_026701 [Melastoma candidum]
MQVVQSSVISAGDSADIRSNSHGRGRTGHPLAHKLVNWVPLRRGELELGPSTTVGRTFGGALAFHEQVVAAVRRAAGREGAVALAKLLVPDSLDKERDEAFHDKSMLPRINFGLCNEMI